MEKSGQDFRDPEQAIRKIICPQAVNSFQIRVFDGQDGSATVVIVYNICKMCHIIDCDKTSFDEKAVYGS